MACIDHVFVFCRTNAPEQQRLIDRGLAVSARRQHDGQGTSNVCFGFANSYLELIWLADEAAASDPVTEPLRLCQRARWRELSANPFGICVRPTTADEAPPLPSWRYRPKYLPDDIKLQIGCNSNAVQEPLLFSLDRPYTPSTTEHLLASAQLVKVAVSVPALAPTSPLHDVGVDGLAFEAGEDHRMTLSFNGAGDFEIDLRPDLPLILRQH